mgnify:CR=1 FL=1
MNLLSSLRPIAGVLALLLSDLPIQFAHGQFVLAIGRRREDFGDPGTRKKAQRDVRDAYYKWTGDTHTDFGLILGDIAYTAGKDAEYQGAIFQVYDKMLRKAVGLLAEAGWTVSDKGLVNAKGEKDRFLLADGSLRYIESQGDVIRDAAGKVAQVVAIVIVPVGCPSPNTLRNSGPYM